MKEERTQEKGVKKIELLPIKKNIFVPEGGWGSLPDHHNVVPRGGFPVPGDVVTPTTSNTRVGLEGGGRREEGSEDVLPD